MLLNISFLSLALIGLSLSILYKLFQAFTDPLRHIPGPFLARFSRLWYLLEVYRGTFELTNIKLHKKHGPVVRIAPNEYSIDDVDAAKTIYGHGNAFVKAQWYAPWSPPDPSKASLFSDLDPHHHASQRRKFAAAYSMSSLVGYECFVDECSALITQRFREIAKLGQTIDMAHWLQCYAFEVIGHITFANRFGLLNMGIDEEGIFSAIDGRTYYGTFVGIYPWIHNKYIYPILLKFGSLGPGYLLKYTIKQIEARQASLKDPRRNGAYEGPTDIMTKILISHETNPEKVSKTDIITMCQSNIGAGSDTTAISLSSIFYHLLKNPQMMQRLRSEIDTAAKEGRISDPITFKESQDHLPYLQAVIKEGLRMHPATGLGLERVVPATGATISGVDFPPGATVGINAWVAHRNTSVFGADASSFRPERWLESPTPNSNDNDNSKQQFEAMDRYFLAFGLGSRTCIGKNISLLEMCKLVPQVVRKFDFGLDEGLQGREWKTLNRWFVKQMDFRVRVFERRMGVQEKM